MIGVHECLQPQLPVLLVHRFGPGPDQLRNEAAFRCAYINYTLEDLLEFGLCHDSGDTHLEANLHVLEFNGVRVELIAMQSTFPRQHRQSRQLGGAQSRRATFIQCIRDEGTSPRLFHNDFQDETSTNKPSLQVVCNSWRFLTATAASTSNRPSVPVAKTWRSSSVSFHSAPFHQDSSTKSKRL